MFFQEWNEQKARERVQWLKEQAEIDKKVEAELAEVERLAKKSEKELKEMLSKAKTPEERSTIEAALISKDKKYVIPATFFNSKYGRYIFPWKLVRDKNYKSPFLDEKGVYYLTIPDKIKTVNFGDDIWKRTGIKSQLVLSAPNVNLVNIDIKVSSDHPYKFNGYDFPEIKKWDVKANQIIFSVWANGQETPKNKTSCPVEKVVLSGVAIKCAIGGQKDLKSIRITSPTKSLNILNLTVYNCPQCELIDLSQIEQIKLRGLEDYTTMDNNVNFLFNPNLKVGLSTLHRWAGWDRHSPFVYQLDNLKEQYHTYEESGMMISIKDILPGYDENTIISQSDLSENITHFLLNKVYKKPQVFKIYNEYLQKNGLKKTHAILEPELQKEYNQWVKDEQARKEKQRIEDEKQAKIWAEQRKKELAAEKARKEKEEKEAKIAYEKKCKKFEEYLKTLPPLQQAYLSIVYENEQQIFSYYIPHQKHSPVFEYMDHPEYLKDIETKEQIKKIMQDAVNSHANIYSDCTDGSYEACKCQGDQAIKCVLEEIDKRVSELEAIKVK